MNIIIFDYDGVIVDSLEIFMDKVISACKKHGSSQVNTKEDFLNLFNGNVYECLIEKGISKEKISNIINDLQIGLKEQKTIKLFDGIKEMLDRLSKNNKLIIITSNLTNVTEESLKLKNINYFEEVMGADKETSKVKKIETIKSKFKGCEIFYIGDTKGDIIEGKESGVKTIAVTWGWHSKDKLKQENPNFIINSPQELVGLFESTE